MRRWLVQWRIGRSEFVRKFRLNFTLSAAKFGANLWLNSTNEAFKILNLAARNCLSCALGDRRILRKFIEVPEV